MGDLLPSNPTTLSLWKLPAWNWVFTTFAALPHASHVQTSYMEQFCCYIWQYVKTVGVTPYTTVILTDWKTTYLRQLCGNTTFVISSHHFWHRNMPTESLAGDLPQHPAYCSVTTMGFTDNVNVVQEPLCTPPSCLPPPPVPTEEKMAAYQKMETCYAEPIHSVWNIVLTFKRCQIYCLRATIISSIEAKIIDWGLDFLWTNMIMVLLSVCLRMLICSRLLRLEFNQGGTPDRAFVLVMSSQCFNKELLE